jgi:hypothetical protein
MNVEELEKLAKLKEKGIITEEEFQKKKSSILNSTSKTEKYNDDEVKLITRCSWDTPANNGAIICLENKIILQPFKIISGWTSLLTAGLLSIILHPIYIKKMRKNNDYKSIKTSDDTIIKLENVNLIEVQRPSKLKPRIKTSIFKNNGDKKVIYLSKNNYLDEFVELYNKVEYV